MTVVEPTTALRRPLVLIGMMGSGKSTVGRRVAAALGVPFADSDSEVERRAGCTIAEIFAAEGEGAFRETEASVVAELVTADQPGVVSTGGGVVLDPATRALLRDRSTVVWLRASPAVLAHRVAADGTRPLLADDPAEALRRLANEREPLYRETADQVVEVGHVARNLVIERVLAAVAAEEARS